MAEELKQLFSNDKADEIISAIRSSGNSESSVSYVRSIGIALISTFNNVAWINSKGDANLSELKNAVYNGYVPIDPSGGDDTTPSGIEFMNKITLNKSAAAGLNDTTVDSNNMTNAYKAMIPLKKYENLYLVNSEVTFTVDGSLSSSGSPVLGARINPGHRMVYYVKGSSMAILSFDKDYGYVLSNCIKSGEINTAKYTYSGGNTFEFSVNDQTTTLEIESGKEESVIPNTAYHLFDNPNITPITGTDNYKYEAYAYAFGAFSIYSVKLYNGNTLIGNYVPCVKDSSIIGVYDKIDGVFYTSTDQEYATIGNSKCVYSVE